MSLVYHIKTALPGLTFKAIEERAIAQEEQALLPRKRAWRMSRLWMSRGNDTSEELERPRLSRLDCVGAPTQSGSGPGLRDFSGGMKIAVPVMTAYRREPLNLLEKSKETSWRW